MKKAIIILVVVAAALSSYAQQKTTATTVTGTQKSAEALVKDVKKGKAYLVDVRTPEEYKAGHLKYSQNIDYKAADFKTSISKLDKSKTIYLYCRTGNRSGKAADTLKVLGYPSYYNIGGFEALKTEGLPAE